MKVTLRPTVFTAALLLALVGTPLVRAQVIISVTATANSTSQGYIATNPYTFIFTTGATFANNPNSFFGATDQEYREDSISTDDQLWSSISGTGLGGSYVRPAGHPDDPSSTLRAAIAGPNYFIQLHAIAEGFVTQHIGKTTLSGSAINGIYAVADVGTLPPFAFPETHVNPNTYFAPYYGTYAGFGTSEPSNADVVTIEFNNHVSFLTFSITSITISAIPEAATYAALLGASALGLVIVRRRRTPRAEM